MMATPHYMNSINRKYILIGLLSMLVYLPACKHDPAVPPLFEVLNNSRTGLDFNNKLIPTVEFNVFKYMYFYNGAGVGTGDFNNDGLPDLFFASNQGDNKIYLNKGNLAFQDVTKKAGIPGDGGWSTGVSIVDINNDGLLDIYVCRVGKYDILNSHNQLLICTGIDKEGIPHYVDRSKEYGLDFSGFSTQAVFFDYDMDGDLDMFLVNHSIHQNGTFGPRSNFLGTYHPLSGDRLYRNDGDKFTDVTRESGINSSAISYGLGVTVADINLDGYPDLYIGNDFHENDYLYINQHNGTFTEENTKRLMHTSQFSMGVDVADINNDGYPDIISMDMLPSDPYILKRSLGEDEYNVFNLKIGYGYNYQYTRNNLQLNCRNGMFSEIGLYAGVYATDWSWSPLWIDFDNDGVKDLFISNGIPKRLNDIDYVNFISNDEIQKKLRSDTIGENDLSLINKFPEIKLPNRFFKNEPNLQFQDLSPAIKNDVPGYSNGAVYADFDNDGDLDIVVNNINANAYLYQNKTNDAKDKAFLSLSLKGSAKNINAVGAKLILFANGAIRTYEKNSVHGFMSSMETPLFIGLDKTKVDSMLLVWPDNTYQRLEWKPGLDHMQETYKAGLPVFDYASITASWKYNTKPATDITNSVNLLYKHEENTFNEFDREPLIPHMVSTEGPALAVGDINHDGLDDVFIGSSKWGKRGLFIQQPNGKFEKIATPALLEDSTYEDVDACFTDVNNDGFQDLVVASGGNEFYGGDDYELPRVYLNDGKGNLSRRKDAFDKVFVNASCVVTNDFNGDGFPDLFIGGRSVPWQYGKIPQSYLLQNDGTGKFKDVTEQLAPGLANIGLVTQAIWFDIDKDGNKDLVLCLEWGGIIAFLNHHGRFEKKLITEKHGWWNFILPVDIDNDGDIDLIAGNLGLNSRLKASPQEPVRLYYYDFDDNGKKEQVLTYYLNRKELPFANKAELERQMPAMKKRFLYAEDFAKASLKELFTADALRKADTLTADYFSNAILINHGNMDFSIEPMPWQAQLSPYRDAIVVDANGDSLPDILLGGNYYENNIEMGRYDADYGTILVNKGNDQFAAENLNGLIIKGQVRHIRRISIGKKEAFVLARNNDSTMVISFEKIKNEKVKLKK